MKKYQPFWRKQVRGPSTSLPSIPNAVQKEAVGERGEERRVSRKSTQSQAPSQRRLREREEKRE